MARISTKDGVAKEDVGYGHIVERKVFAGQQIPDNWEYDDVEGDTDVNATLQRNKEAVERGDLDPDSAHLGDLEAKAPEPTTFNPAEDLAQRNRAAGEQKAGGSARKQQASQAKQRSMGAQEKKE